MKPVVRLRPLTRNDLDLVASWLQRDDVRQRLLLSDDSGKDQQAWFDRYEASTDKFVYAILADDRHVGNISLFNVDATNQRAQLSIFIGEKALRGGGIGSAAMAAAFSIAFGEMHLNRVWLEVLSDNEAAIRCYENVGMRCEGILREHVMVCNAPRDMAVYSIIRDDFLKESQE